MPQGPFLLKCVFLSVDGDLVFPVIADHLDHVSGHRDIVPTVIAVGIAAPLGFITALFLVNAPKWLGYPLSQALDLLAAIPSIIYGMWGLFVLAPVMQDYIQPFLADTLCLGSATPPITKRTAIVSPRARPSPMKTAPKIPRMP